MKPLKLVFNGVKSFSSPATIDFEKLTASGLFGIFGDTGSGKSTILDSINFALYGNVDRSKKKTDIINYNCDQAEVSFTFNILLDGRRRVYRVERSIKKKSGIVKAMLYENDGQGERCIADNATSVNDKVEYILGVNADDFRKCIALPQGEFAQFVTSVPSERLKLIERLFSLGKYGDGLRERLSAAENDAVIKLTEVRAKYDVLADVTDELVSSLEESNKKLSEEVQALEKESAAAEQSVAELKKIYDLSRELADTQAQLEKYAAQSAKMERLRQVIKSAPACKSVCDADERKKSAQKLAANCAEGEAVIQKKIAENRAKLDALMQKRAGGDYDGGIEKLTARLALLQSAMEDVNSLAEESGKLSALRKSYQTSAERKRELDGRKALAQQKAQAARAELEGCKVPDIAEVLENKFKPGILKDEYRSQLTYIDGLRKKIKPLDDGSRLYDFIDGELEDRINYIQTALAECGDEDIDVKGEIAKLDRLTARREALFNAANKAAEALARAERELALADSECVQVQKDGKTCSERVEKLRQKLALVFGEDCKDFKAAVADVQAKLKALKQERDTLDKSIEGQRSDIANAELSLNELKVRRQTAEADGKSAEEAVARELAAGAFKDVEECRAILAEVSAYGDGETALRQYDERVYALKSRAEQLSGQKGEREVTAEQLAEQSAKLADIKGRAKDRHAEQRLTQAKLAESKGKLQQKAALEGELAARTKRRDLIYQLKELVKGNKFLEYIAGEYLSDISKAASATLLRLTMGRYYLAYTDTFYVADNFNEGKLRGVNTLSGGETFLVSLSLALALSSSICKSSMRSIEFFFLDEGFGTLDESLVDIVMDTLEKLRSSDFTIGIISHVEELKHRIDSKITVNKATETHGSSVTVSV